jgi:hypothetical protein
MQMYVRLREEFPYQSIEERLPSVKADLLRNQLPPTTTIHLTRQEEVIEEFSHSTGGFMLRQIHEGRVRLFINSPGFGVSRRIFPSEESIKSRLRPDELIPQPGIPSTSPLLPDEIQWNPSPSEDFYATHLGGILDFVYPQGFGYLKDRRHVAGFQSHRFSRPPESKDRWKVETVVLLGLLLHPEPIAYVSNNLPRMDELRKAPTRKLDLFESQALQKIREGEDLIVAETSRDLRMLGAIRSTKQCLQCHEGERGDLLGAFSYLLRKK